MSEIDISDVNFRPVSLGESHLKAEVSTPHGVAQLEMDLSGEETARLKVVLPSGNEYQGTVDSWDGDAGPRETDLGISATLELAAAFILQCFEKEAAGQD